MHGVLHLRPYFFQIIENFRSFNPFDVIGNTDSVFFAVRRDFRKRIEIVNFGGIVLSSPDDFDCAPAHAQNAPSVNDVSVRQCDKIHRVFVRDILFFGVENDFRRFFERGNNDTVGAVPLPGHCERAVKYDFERIGVFVIFGKNLASLFGAHRMRR